MPYHPRQTMRQASARTAEAEDLAEDLVLIHEAEALTLGYDWERGVLEECSERAYRNGRALMPRQRQALSEILQRRQGGGQAE